MNRELFEEWALSVGWSVGRHFKNDDVYAHSYCQCGWQAWQASEKSAKERQEHPAKASIARQRGLGSKN